jgi:two-component system, LytTR family, response regulator
MNVLIIEDEIPAAEKLERYLHKYNEAITVVHKLTGVADSVAWLQQHQNDIELIFMDIQLADGKSFEIFEQVTIDKPIIFTTAFDEYAIEAFKVNSIDYLLKPVTFDDLSQAMTKLEGFKKTLNANKEQPFDLKHALTQLQQKTYKTRFMVKLGEHIRSLTVTDISFFYAEGRDVYLVTNEKRKFIIDYKLEELDDLLDPTLFYRVNRSFIMNINAIKDVVVFSSSRLKITPTLEFDKEIIVSREKVAPFKEWFNGL